MEKRIRDKYNGRIDDLTIEEIRSCPLFAQLSDAQVWETIDTLKEFVLIIYDYYDRGRDSLRRNRN